MVIVDSWRIRDKIKQVIKLAIGEGFYCPDNKLLVNLALAFPYPVNLAYRYPHSLC